jgi:steroid 5-alpha reductase family enzyme
MNWTTLLAAIVLQGAVLSAAMASAWLVQRRTGNSGWIDFSWTAGVGTVGVASALAPLADTEPTSRQLLVAALVAFWSLRLASHIAMRTIGGSDDPRYAALAREWGDAAPRRMFHFAQAQAVASLPLVATIFIAAHRPGSSIDLQDAAGAGLLALAIAGEGLADRQLTAFRAEPHNSAKVCDRGLWRWSRHPNYFFQWLGWLAYPMIAIVGQGGYAWGWLTIAAPLCMYWLLVHVSGIPPLEAHMLRSRGQAFRDYQSRTSPFFPLPPGRAS